MNDEKQVIHIRRTKETGEYMSSSAIRTAGYTFDARGGATIILVPLPAGGYRMAMTLCNELDNYDKKFGRDVCLARLSVGAAEGNRIDSISRNIVAESRNYDLLETVGVILLQLSAERMVNDVTEAVSIISEYIDEFFDELSTEEKVTDETQSPTWCDGNNGMWEPHDRKDWRTEPNPNKDNGFSIPDSQLEYQPCQGVKSLTENKPDITWKEYQLQDNSRPEFAASIATIELEDEMVNEVKHMSAEELKAMKSILWVIKD